MTNNDNFYLFSPIFGIGIYHIDNEINPIISINIGLNRPITKEEICKIVVILCLLRLITVFFSFILLVSAFKGSIKSSTSFIFLYFIFNIN